MYTLVTGFNGKVGFEVARKLKASHQPIKCAVRNTEKAKQIYGDQYEFTSLDFSDPTTFQHALKDISKIFLIYPPGDQIEFEEFLTHAKQHGVSHIIYLSVKDVQFLPFIHHFKNEKLIKKLTIPYTFIRAGYFMQNLNDFLGSELKIRHRIYVPAGKGKTSFVDTRDIAEVVSIVLQGDEKHHYQKYVITGNEALDFYEVASRMSEVLQTPIHYANPSIKEFREFMLKTGEDERFINVVIGIHIPTKLGLAKGIKNDFQILTSRKPTAISTYIEDYKDKWL